MSGYLSDRAIARATEAMHRLWETRRDMAGGGLAVRLSRYDPVKAQAGDPIPYTALPPQVVVVEWANVQTAQVRDEAGQVANVSGFLVRPEPFDVEVGDYFAQGDPGSAETARVVRVQRANFGMTRAAFVQRVGEA